ncbi:MAG: 50S ribosomal protein L9 [Actinobacteria bacterium]|nr:50S ribosomal protein L9 [Actinomycetota bacterium]MDQ3531671.1 50S ribosomal protein L9 [Actinomycetota bacterium]
MQIILAQDVEKLGLKGDLVSVADGYARNFLVPKGLAISASKGTMKQAELMRRARLEREQRVKEAAAARVATLGAEPVFISARAGDGGRLFGSVTSSDVARAIEEQLDESVDRHDIRLDDPIRSLGTHQVEVRLHAEVNALVNVEVIAHEE